MTAPHDFLDKTEEGVVETIQPLNDEVNAPELSAAELLAESLPELLANSLRSNYTLITKIYSTKVLPHLALRDPVLINNKANIDLIAPVIYLFINIAILRSGFPDKEVVDMFRNIYDQRISQLPKKLRIFLEGDEDANIDGVLSEIRKVVDTVLKEL